MPTLSSMKIPPPKNWDEFECICQSALKIKWGSPNLQRNGRQGQAQAGVDIYGDDDLGKFVGVQSKNVGEELKIDTVKQEIAKAEQFEPPISSFYIATTLPNDALLQRKIRLLSIERVKNNNFPVGIFFWEDIIQELVKNPQDFSSYYPEIKLNIEDPWISGPQLLCNLDIAFFGIQIQNYIGLIFGELGAMAGEDPMQICGLGSTIKSCASVLLKDEKANELNSKIDNLVSSALKQCESKDENDRRWAEVDKLCTLIIQDISGLEYRLTGVFMAAFRLGIVLGKWNIRAVEADYKLPDENIETIIDLFSALDAPDELKKRVLDAIKEHNTTDKVSNVNIPHRIYNFSRRLILKREILSQQQHELGLGKAAPFHSAAFPSRLC